MLDRKVQSEADDWPESESPIRYYKGRPVFPGRLDTSTDELLRASKRITELALRAKREGWPGW